MMEESPMPKYRIAWLPGDGVGFVVGGLADFFAFLQEIC